LVVPKAHNNAVKFPSSDVASEGLLTPEPAELLRNDPRLQQQRGEQNEELQEAATPDEYAGKD